MYNGKLRVERADAVLFGRLRRLLRPVVPASCSAVNSRACTPGTVTGRKLHARMRLGRDWFDDAWLVFVAVRVTARVAVRVVVAVDRFRM